MNTTTLRIKGWISALRPYALIALILGGLYAFGLDVSLYKATRAAKSPEVKIRQLAREEIEQLGVTGGVIVLCAAILAFPAIVFEPAPPAVAPAVAGVGVGDIQVSGKLSKASKRNPFEATKRRMNFARANAQLFKLDPNGLMVSVHRVVYRSMGWIPLGKIESDWLAKIYPHQVVRLEPGKLYAFNQRWAVRFVYKADGDKETVLVISFEHNRGQAAFINLLKERGFAIQTLGYASSS